MPWDSLPLEIQTHILEALVLHGDSARYASICRVWQTIIERRIFAHLRVTRSRLAGFSDIGYRHRHLVKYIWFSIEPDPFPCPHCGGVKVNNLHHVSSKTIRKAIQDLVIQLSIWESSGSLLLDISVKAPSGLMHSSSTIQYGPPVISERKKDKIIQCSHLLEASAANLFNQTPKVRARTQPRYAKGESCHKPPPAPSNSPSLEARSTRRASRPSSRGPRDPLRTLERLASNGGTIHQYK